MLLGYRQMALQHRAAAITASDRATAAAAAASSHAARCFCSARRRRYALLTNGQHPCSRRRAAACIVKAAQRGSSAPASSGGASSRPAATADGAINDFIAAFLQRQQQQQQHREQPKEQQQRATSSTSSSTARRQRQTAEFSKPPPPHQQQQQQQSRADTASTSSNSSSTTPALNPGALLAPRQRRPRAASPRGPPASGGGNGKPAAAAAVDTARNAPQRAPAAAAARGSTRQHAPVYKGDLALPGGPQWSPLRRHVHAAGADPGLPTLSAVVIVEGDQDQRALAKAVNAPVYVCGGTRVLRPHAAAELEALARLGRPLIILTDPDERGRQLRAHLDDALAPLLPPPDARRPDQGREGDDEGGQGAFVNAADKHAPPRVLHAFVPEASAVALADGAVHAAGNRGIEHAVPGALALALRAAAPSYPRGRCAWDLERLQALGLARAFDAGGRRAGARRADSAGAAAGLEPRDRRRQLCAALGLGRCSGAQLAAALNRYFSEARVEAALAALNLGGEAGSAAPP